MDRDTVLAVLEAARKYLQGESVLLTNESMELLIRRLEDQATKSENVDALVRAWTRRAPKMRKVATRLAKADKSFRGPTGQPIISESKTSQAFDEACGAPPK